MFQEMDLVTRKSTGSDKGNPLARHCSYVGFVDEFGVFVKRNDLDFMAALAKLYDCPDIFEYKTKHQGEDKLENVCLTLVAGCTPTWIRLAFPAEVFETGLPARMVTVYSGDRGNTRDLFLPANEGSSALLKDLEAGIKKIHSLRGEFTYEEEAQRFLQTWYNEGMQPMQSDPRMEHYNTRRLLHFNKIAMAVSASTGSAPVIKLSDAHEAKTLMLEVEAVMPKALEQAGESPFSESIRLVMRMVGAAYPGRIREHKIHSFLLRMVAPYQIDGIIESMLESRWLEASGDYPVRSFKLTEKEGMEYLRQRGGSSPSNTGESSGNHQAG